MTALMACDNLTDFVGHSRGLDLAFNARPWQNLSDPDRLLRFESTSNVTCLEHAPRLTPGIFFKVIILTILAILSFVGNVATIYSIAKNRRKQHRWSTVYALILHLAVADLLVTVFCIGGEAMWSYTVTWMWGNAMCKLFKFLQVFSLYLSTFILVLIGADRFIAVRYPMKGLNTGHRCLRLVIPAWILSFVLAIPQVIIFHVAKGPFLEEFDQCVTHGFYTEPWQEQLYVSLSLIFMFLLPLVILITTYVSTIITISRSERMFKLELSNKNVCRMNGDLNRRKLMHRAKMKSLRISVVIVAAFILWWTPYYAMMIILMFLHPDKRVSDELQNGIFFFGMSNSLVNPLIYGAFHLWPRKKRRNSYHRELSTLQRRLTPTNHDSSFKRDPREMREPFLSKNNSNTTI
ncbi:gonadotropin-releasing hormone receptor isoform X1 [Colletes gigas]|uniref:gonadotropin-releasing hormone receptor isoform X1 n=1 Tax=Colletes gigas TaxID=935657 RepID=UPI001C9B5F81|nr:gonadotropin-releasing hormone receptor isoform X1 [Colletes gigas]XP_043257554.1 gonadotropin-releasing hormone receptor isoform X1 [Colletes gigas]XP_043257555.1 gonadotropin-releasing hormone receptor isoform X1 [Colletes gigas]XP_043257556.1 gonadotropin-releasing hormone receptor isoform X1 [Colletes gigas]XP_043257558.1 gonadotropin-releasing hormone receptor isoform X1 [Colletes gigas]